MTNLYKCLEDFKSISSADHDFPLEFFKTYVELHQNLMELQHLITHDPENVVEIQTLLNCMLNTGNGFDDHIKDIHEFLQFYQYTNELDRLLKP